MLFNRLEHSLKIEKKLSIEKQRPRQSRITRILSRLLIWHQGLRAAIGNETDKQALETKSRANFETTFRTMSA